MFHLEYKFLLEIFGVVIIKIHNNRFHNVSVLDIVTVVIR